MLSTAKKKRRTLGQIRASFYAAPWALNVRALGMIQHGIESKDLEAIKAALCMGDDGAQDLAENVDGIAIIPVTGVLQDANDFLCRWGYASSYQQIEESFNAAVASSDVRGIMFYCDSPGGSAVGCKRLADLVYAARGDKPIRAFTQGMACSAMYYVAAACDQIDATADALVGSVGTIYPHMEISGFLKEIGYSAKVFTNTDSPKKGHGNQYEPLSEAATATLQKYVDSYGRPFVEDVATYRGITPEDVVAKYGQGDAVRASVAIGNGMVDAIVTNFQASLDSISTAAGASPSANNNPPAALAAASSFKETETMSAKVKAQLFALGLIASIDASDEVCNAALAAFFAGRGKSAPSDESAILAGLRGRVVRAEADAEDESAKDDAKDEDDEEDDDEEDPVEDEEDAEDKASSRSRRGKAKAGKTRRAPVDEQAEARFADLEAAASLVNLTAGCERVTAAMVLASVKAKHNAAKAVQAWSKELTEAEPAVPGNVSITGNGSDRFAEDAAVAMAFRAGGKVQLTPGARSHVHKPLWAIACASLQMSGRKDIDLYTDRELIASEALTMGSPGRRLSSYSAKESERYVRAAASPAARPGDFPAILANLATKFIDLIELDDDYSYPLVSCQLPGGLNDFKPALMVNKGIVEELDEVQDAEAFKELGLSEEVLSYLFLRRFGNKWGWTPVLLANDDMNAFAEGMIGLAEAWQVTQNRLVMDRFTSSETLLDGSALFANRTDTGSATNDNDIDSGGATPSDAQWGLMEAAYADIGGIATGRRVRGTLNTWFGPTGTAYQDARRCFMPLNADGLESKVAETTSNVGIYRGKVAVVPESELRTVSSLVWYGLRSPTQIRTATVVRAYFNGFGEQGRRESWYDFENKCQWTSIEGRVAVAVKNWRYAVKNKGAA